MKTTSLLLGRRRGMGGLLVMTRDPGHLGGIPSKRPGSATAVSTPRLQTLFLSLQFHNTLRTQAPHRSRRLARVPTRELTRCLARIASTSRCAGKPQSFRQRPRSHPRFVNLVGKPPIMICHFQELGAFRGRQVFGEIFAIDSVFPKACCQLSRRLNCHCTPPSTQFPIQ